LSTLGWKLARLRAMSPGEIAHRARVALRDRLLPPRYASLPPDEAARLLFEGGADAAQRTSHLARWARALDPAEFASATDAARELLEGRWSLFGREVRLDDPPRWNRDPASGAEWPDVASRAIDFRRGDIAGGPKPVWELGRLTMLPTLALASRLTGEPAFADRAVAWLADFTARNPLGRGIHHTSGIEMAVRVLTGCWTLALLGERADAARLSPALGLLAQQALWCRDHLSLGSSANNHLIAEYAGFATLGAAFPELRGSAALMERGLAGLERECLRQIHEDGAPAEQAWGYLPFVWELFLIPFLACEAAGRTVSASAKDRLRRSLEFARTIRLPDGRWPRIGDEDDGRVLLAHDEASRLDRVGNALAAWLGDEALGDGDPTLARLLVGRPPRAARVAADGRHEFAQGGYTVWRERGLLVTLDHGPLGLGSLAAHGHADALSVTVFRGADDIVVDPGTFAYQEDPVARDRCRGTPAHGTIQFGGRSQSEMLGPFLWGRRARVRPDGGEHECLWASGERHARRVEVGEGRILIADRVQGDGAELGFALAPGAKVLIDGRRATLTIGGTRATFEADGIEGWSLAAAEYAPRFAQRVAASRLVGRIPGGECTTEVRLGPR
jgi:hypothetical protein